MVVVCVQRNERSDGCVREEKYKDYVTVMQMQRNERSAKIM